jgi:hypothetical protein
MFNTSNACTLILSVYVKFLKTLQEDNDYFNTHYNISL